MLALNVGYVSQFLFKICSFQAILQVGTQISVVKGEIADHQCDQISQIFHFDVPFRGSI